MKIGLIIATEEEYETLVAGFKIKASEENDIYNTFHFVVNGNDIYGARSGIGEIAATSLTQYLITKYGVELIFNYGVCGALKKTLAREDVVLVKGVVHYDFDISQIDPIEKGRYPEFEMPLIPTSLKYRELVKTIIPNMKEVVCASGDKFIASEKIQNELVNEFDADICDMESAGIVLTAIKNKVDIISLKGVSDSASDNEYSEFAKRASEVVFEVLKEIIYSL